MTIRDRLISWLGVGDQSALIAGLRRDLDACVELQGKIDQALQRTIPAIVKQLNGNTSVLGDIHQRVDAYERSVPALLKARQRLNAQRTRAKKLAEKEVQVAGSIEPPVETMAVTDGESA